MNRDTDLGLGPIGTIGLSRAHISAAAVTSRPVALIKVHPTCPDLFLLLTHVSLTENNVTRYDLHPSRLSMSKNYPVNVTVMTCVDVHTLRSREKTPKESTAYIIRDPYRQHVEIQTNRIFITYFISFCLNACYIEKTTFYLHRLMGESIIFGRSCGWKDHIHFRTGRCRHE